MGPVRGGEGVGREKAQFLRQVVVRGGPVRLQAQRGKVRGEGAGRTGGCA